jgi:hypothetical protein
VYRDSMRAWFVVCLAGCSFDPSGATSSGGPPPSQDSAISTPADSPNPPHAPDAPNVRAVDAAIDAHPDACPDSDGDGICDDQDTWPCGAQPTAPPATVTMTTNGTKTKFVISNIDVDSKGQQVVAAPNTTVDVTFHYAITDTACDSNCDDQIEIGWIPGHRTGCPFDNGVSKQNGASGDISTTITLPSGSGEVDLRSNIGQNLGCTYNGANDWWDAPPGSNWTLANVCVH